jgi:hypothetical protein
MKTRSIAVSLVLIAVSFAAGYWFSQEKSGKAELDLITAARGADLHNRLSMIRFFREKNPQAEEIASMEISAISLLKAINLEALSKDSASSLVLKKVADTLVTYRKDFPKTELDPTKDPQVAKLLSLR